MILNELNTICIGRNIIRYDCIDSTQKEAWRLISKNIKNGSLIVANIQTEGRGTHGRKWYTDVSGNIAFSLVLYPSCNIGNLKDITLNIAKVIVETFENLYEIKLHIKRPNDIVFNGKKLGGILTETKLSGETVNKLVIGIGINLNQEIFNDEISKKATSIKKEFGICVDRNKIIAEICNLLEIYMKDFLGLNFVNS